MRLLLALHQLTHVRQLGYRLADDKDSDVPAAVAMVLVTIITLGLPWIPFLMVWSLPTTVLSLLLCFFS